MDTDQTTPQAPAPVNGWGVDADPANDPTYPMKKRTDAEHRGYTWDRPPLQPDSVEILHSNERPGLTSVFGTAAPPSGLSGMIRRFAFRYSESSYGHWLPLMLADRVNMIEGVVDDLKQGKVPNVAAEMGLAADWRHNRPRLVMKCLIGAGIMVSLYQITRRHRHQDRF